MAEIAMRRDGAVPLAVGAAVAGPRVNWGAKLNDIKFTPKVPVAPKFAPPKLAPFPKALPLPSAPMPNLPGSPILGASGPAGGILSALFPLAMLAILATALREMVGKIVKPNKLQPAH